MLDPGELSKSNFPKIRYTTIRFPSFQKRMGGTSKTKRSQFTLSARAMGIQTLYFLAKALE
jgi:hypothetical protein